MRTTLAEKFLRLWHRKSKNFSEYFSSKGQARDFRVITRLRQDVLDPRLLVFLRKPLSISTTVVL